MRGSCLIKVAFYLIPLGLAVNFLSAADQRPLKAEDIPDGTELMNVSGIAEVSKNLGSAYQWPNRETIARDKVDNSTISFPIMESIQEWVRIVIKEEYIPNDLERRLILMKAGVGGYDVARIRYTIPGKYSIQITQSSFAIWVLVRPLLGRKEVSTPEEAKEYMGGIINELFNESATLRSSACEDLEMTSFGFKAGSSDIRDWWSNTIRVYSDGQAIGIGISKDRGGKTEPPQIKNWFEPQPFRVTAIKPSDAEAGTVTDVEVVGAGFDPTVGVYIVEARGHDPATGIVVRSTLVKSSTNLMLKLDLGADIVPKQVEIVFYKLAQAGSGHPKGAIEFITRFPFRILSKSKK